MPRKKIEDDKPIVTRRRTKNVEEVVQETKEVVKENVKEEAILKEEKQQDEVVAESKVLEEKIDKSKGEKKKTVDKPKEEKKPEKEAKTALEKEIKKEKHQENEKSMNTLIETVGIKSKEILESEKNIIPDDKVELDQKEKLALKELTEAQKSHDILWGTVYEVGNGLYELSGHVIFSVMYNGIRVQIPDNLFYEKTFDFGKEYSTLPEDGTKNARTKYRIRRERGNYYNGARVCFIVKHVTNNPITSGRFSGMEEPMVFGSRVEAMSKLREIYFGKESKMNVQTGNLAIANVVGVRSDKVRVECLGIETQIDAYNSNEKGVVNCEELFRTGDQIKVRIRKLHVNNVDDAYISVSGRLNDVNKMINTMSVDSTYMGYVDNFNPVNNRYHITLANGVAAEVMQKNVNNIEKLERGDRVFVKVLSIKNGRVTGLALKA